MHHEFRDRISPEGLTLAETVVKINRCAAVVKGGRRFSFSALVTVGLAVDRLAELGLTYPDKSGSVVYYDIEYYGTNTDCREAVNAFMNGWVSQVRALGNLAGVYGSTLCDTGLSDFLTITNVPDVIWPARWYHNAGEGYYDPSASVWNLGSCIPNTVWADHQRIRQYEGDHDETWGGLTLGIDSNVLDGVVAVPALDPSKILFEEVAGGLNNHLRVITLIPYRCEPFVLFLEIVQLYIHTYASLVSASIPRPL